MQKNHEFYVEHLALLTIIGIPYDEQETIVNYSRDNDTAYITTTDPTVFNQLKKKALTNPDEWELYDVTVRSNESNVYALSSATLTCPKRLISFRSKTGEGRQMSEEQRAAAAERLKNAREQKNGQDNM